MANAKTTEVPQTEVTPVIDGFGGEENGLVDTTSPAEELQGLNQEQNEIERIKVHEKSTILSPIEFERNRANAMAVANNAMARNDFNFKAGKDPMTGKRFFNVKGFADKNHLYRAAKMVKEDKTYYFLSQSYDTIFGSSNEKQLSVIAWIKVGKAAKAMWQQSPVSKNELIGVETISMEEGRVIFEAIKKQGGDPTI